MRSYLFASQVILVGCFLLLSLAACAPEGETAVSPTPPPAEATTIPTAAFTSTAAVPTIAATEAAPIPTATATQPATTTPQATEVPPTPWAVAVPADQAAVPLPVKEEITFTIAAQLGGTAEAIAMDGSIVYLGLRQRLVTVDISDPAAPRFLGQSEALPDVVQAVALQNGLAYVGAGRDLHIYDVSNPAMLGRISTFSSVDGLEQDSWVDIIPAGVIVYTINVVPGPDFSFKRLTAFDVSNPAQPVVVATRDLNCCAGVAVSGDVVYIAYEGRLQLVDARLNTTLGEVELRDDASNPHFVAVAGNLAYIGVSEHRSDGEEEHLLLAVDISNPAQPEVVTASQLDFHVASFREMAATDEALFLVTVGNVHGFCPYSLQVVDITDAAPRHASFEPHSCISDIAVAGDTLVAATDDRGLQIFDASDPTNLTLADEFAYPPGFTGAGAIVLNQDMAYLVSGDAGWGERMTLRVLDRAQPAAPIAVGPSLDLPPDMGIEGLYVRGNRLYVVPYNYPMLVLDISEPANPHLITDAGVQPEHGNWPVPALAGNALYMPAGNTLQIMDISNPANPVLINTIRPAPGTFFQRGSVTDRYLIASGPGSHDAVRLQLYDVSEPFQPVEVGQFQLPDPYLSVTTVVGDTLYAIASDLGGANVYLYVLNMSDPAQPAAAGRFALPFGVQEMVAAGDTLYISGWYLNMPEPPGGIWALNVSDSAQPYLAGQLQLPGNIYSGGVCRTCSLSVDGDLLYLARGDAGLLIVPVEK